jgi:preprotein translocase subunit SecY
MKPTFYQSLKKIAEDLELSSNQIYDIFEGRTTKKYMSKMMPKISIKKIQSAS